MSSDASKMTIRVPIPDGFSVDCANPKYRQFKNRDGILEYTIEGDNVTVDWVAGKNTSAMIQQILDYEGSGVSKVAGYVTDRLGATSDEALQRLGTMLAQRLTGGCAATIQRIEGRRYLVLTR